MRIKIDSNQYFAKSIIGLIESQYYRGLKGTLSLIAITDIDMCRETISNILGASNVGQPNISVISLSKIIQNPEKLTN
jgi:hypothetical protein